MHRRSTSAHTAATRRPRAADRGAGSAGAIERRRENARTTPPQPSGRAVLTRVSETTRGRMRAVGRERRMCPPMWPKVAERSGRHISEICMHAGPACVCTIGEAHSCGCPDSTLWTQQASLTPDSGQESRGAPTASASREGRGGWRRSERAQRKAGTHLNDRRMGSTWVGLMVWRRHRRAARRRGSHLAREE